MSLPINIKDLVHGKAVEWERLEFKKDWNPEPIIHTMCAFANDMNNWGGGYIIVGIEEKDGQAVLPPSGLSPHTIDKIQGEVLRLANQISPHYYPLIQPYILEEQQILVLWCPAGDNRPYTAPSTLGGKAQRYPYIRYGSRSIVAKEGNLRRLHELTARIPFDDRINRLASIQDFDLGLIRAFLHEVKSDLFEESKNMSLADLSRNMLIAKGPDEELNPVNVGLLFFTQKPEQYFSRCWIEVVVHKDFSGKGFTETYFKGPIHQQLRDVLRFIQTTVIHEVVEKLPDRAEANRYFNFPYIAVEEALSNAVYHKSYEVGNPIEVQIWPDKIEILSFPGPVPPVDAQILQEQRRIVSRDNRNRRIGDFLKELDLTEGRGTGLPTIYREMERNSSPKPIFETDESCAYFLSILPANATFVEKEEAGIQVNLLHISKLSELVEFSNQAGNQASNQASVGASDQAKRILNDAVHDKVEEILIYLKIPQARADTFNHLHLTNQAKNRMRYLDPLLNYGWIEMTIPDKPSSPNQKYRITESGMKLLEILKSTDAV